MAAKRGQVTAFVIIGAVILAMTGFVFYLISGGGEEVSESELEAESVKLFISSCVRSTAIEAIFYIGEHGGYYAPPEPYKDYMGKSIPYYYFLEETYVPDVSSVEEGLSRYISAELPECTNDFEAFTEQGYAIEEGNVSARVNVTDDNVIFEVDYPVELVTGDSRQSIKSYIKTIDIDLKDKLRIAGDIAEKQKETGNKLPLSFLLDLAHYEGFTYNITDFPQPDYGLDLIFEEEPFTEPFVLSFVIGQGWGDAD